MRFQRTIWKAILQSLFHSYFRLVKKKTKRLNPFFFSKKLPSGRKCRPLLTFYLKKIICASNLKELNYFYGVHAKIIRLFGLSEHLKTSLNFAQFSIQFYLKRVAIHFTLLLQIHTKQELSFPNSRKGSVPYL